jgi:hypothetical protein
MKIKRRKKMQDGSALILTLVAVLILSSLAVTGLTVSSTEVQSTQNFYLNKRAYYAALEGVEELRNEIFRNPAPEYVTTLIRDIDQTTDGGTSDFTYYITGSLDDLYNYTEYSTPLPNITFFDGFNPPPLPSVGMGGKISVAPVIWSVHVTACVSFGNKKSYAEIHSGVYSIVSTGY